MKRLYLTSGNAWLYSEAPGPGVPDCQFNYANLDTWKAGRQRGANCCYVMDAWHSEACEQITIDENTLVYGVQIEALGWIAASQAKIRNVQVNDDFISPTILPSNGFDFSIATKFDLLNSGAYEQITTVTTG